MGGNSVQEPVKFPRAHQGDQLDEGPRAIHTRGPATEHGLVLKLGYALHFLGKWDLWVNDPVFRQGSAIAGNAAIGGRAAIATGTATFGPSGPTPPGTPVSIMVGIKPVKTWPSGRDDKMKQRKKQY